jgi:rfaE bifunctional protein kinase chain/domain
LENVITANELKDETCEDAFGRTATLLERIPETTVVVFGDFCIDAYWDLAADSEEISVETGLPVRRVRSQRYSLGGAGNVVANLAALGVGKIRPVCLVGADPFGDKLWSLLEAAGAEMDGVLTDARWQTMVYAKPLEGEREESRIDFGAFNELPGALRQELLENLRAAVEDSHAVILNQQVPGGVSSPEMIAEINRIIAENPAKLFLVDARHYPGEYRGAMLKVNISEATRLLGEPNDRTNSEASAAQFALRIHRQLGKPVFLTRGEHGLVVASEDQIRLIPGIQVLERTDPVGAGDTVASALAAAMAVGASAAEAASLANLAANVTVKKLHITGTASPAEILEVAREPNYIFRAELSDSARGARYLAGSEIEIIDEIPRNLNIRHAIFDHDGTLSTLREGWEHIMEPMMLRAILGGAYHTVDQPEFNRITTMVRQFIDRTTGIQTLVQMQGLVRLVRESGYVPEEEILDEHGYKHLYNLELLAMVNMRVEKLRRGELTSTDFQIKNAFILLEELYRRGIKLYLASGTDEQDVVAEAEAMGYSHMFEGRIFGAVGDPNIEAKKVVIQRILREHSLSGHQLATFGDGPVEMRETQRRGGFCIGVASDELRRFGLNLRKRRRLIRAGANIIIPDYSQLSMLLNTLQVRQ